ncbi:MAG: hypothetical protein M3P18_22090 [Actinomycetota bacterium]|nr:hypothetical protein [Actinomycetota bacterium]
MTPSATLDVTAALIIAAPLTFAGLGKLFDPNEFRGALRRYRIPSWTHRPLSIALPWLEVGAAVGSIVVASALLSALVAALYLAFAGTMTVSWLSGVRGDCGCFGPASSMIGPGAIIRTSALGVLASALAMARLVQAAPQFLLERSVLAFALLAASGVAILIMNRLGPTHG